MEIWPNTLCGSWKTPSCLNTVPGCITEGAENSFKVMFVLKSNVLLNNCGASRLPVFLCSGRRNRCACHMHLHSRLRNREALVTDPTSAGYSHLSHFRDYFGVAVLASRAGYLISAVCEATASHWPLRFTKTSVQT